MPFNSRLQSFGLVALLVVIGLLFTWFQWSNNLPDPDAFYHMRMAQLIADEGIIREFIWLPYTTLANHFVDQHFLYHVLMIPFVSFEIDTIGVKIFVILLALLFFLSFALCIRTFGSRWWLVATAILALSTPFTFRLNLVKATPLALVVLCATMILLYKRLYWGLLPLGVMFVWSYGGFAMMIVVVTAWIIAGWLSQFSGSVETRLIASLRPLAYTISGIILGLVVNPYFPDNIFFYWDQLVQIGIINYQNTIGVGAEWYPYHPGRLLFGSIGVFLFFGIALTFKIIRKEKWQQLDWFALGIAGLGLGLTLKSRRYIEYFGPYTVMAAAIWLRHCALHGADLYSAFTHYIKRSLGYALLGMGVIALLTAGVLHDVSVNTNDLRSGTPTVRYAVASQWLREQATPGSKILHSDWDDFPILFYHNSNNAYMAGLDPTFMYRHDPDLYELWSSITLGEYTGDLTAALSVLDVEYVLVENNHVAMYNLIHKSPVTTLVYSDDEVDIFLVDIKQ